MPRADEDLVKQVPLYIVTRFLTVLPVTDSSASGLHHVLTQYLESVGLDIKNLVEIASDGASVMVAVQSDNTKQEGSGHRATAEEVSKGLAAESDSNRTGRPARLHKATSILELPLSPE
ncbi:UNVERIFIED_CONTAM: hypothetical protein FKN15_067830 [Acipenser sinensis]